MSKNKNKKLFNANQASELQSQNAQIDEQNIVTDAISQTQDAVEQDVQPTLDETIVAPSEQNYAESNLASEQEIVDNGGQNNQADGEKVDSESEVAEVGEPIDNSIDNASDNTANNAVDNASDNAVGEVIDNSVANTAGETSDKTADTASVAIADATVPTDDKIAVDGAAIQEEEYKAFKLENNQEKYKKTKELSKESKKNRIIVISILAVLLLTAVTLSIALPLYFHYKDMIMISSIEDFDKVDKGTYFVLNKDVTVNGDLDLSARKNYSIDLNGHSLSITGVLTYATDASLDIKIGTIKKKVYIAKGNLSAQKIVINAPNSDASIMAAIQADSINVTAKSMTFTSASVRNDIDVTAQTVNLKGNVSTDSQGKTVVTNCSSLTVMAKVTGALVLNSSSLVAMIGSQMQSVKLDDKSVAKISGVVDGFVEGGSVVAMLNGHTCKEYRKVGALALYTDSAKEYTAIDCGKIIHIEQLQTPTDLIVEERSGGQIVAVIGSVLNATQYSFIVDGKEAVLTSAHELDITALMANGGAGKHAIIARAVGNYKFDTLKDLSDGVTVYTDSADLTYDYGYTIQLATPEGLTVTNENGKLMLSFKKVAFASKYNIVINGKIFTPSATKDAVQKFDITEYITEVGAYKIKVSAHSDIAEIMSSKDALVVYNNVQQLAQVENIIAVTKDNKLQISWTKVANGKSYAIYVEDENGQIRKLATTTLDTYTLDNLPTYKKVFVKAEAHGFYLEVSNLNGVDIVPAS
ncbi:MAG: hypothetical protein RR416_02725 [Clostridia bacterium]